MRFTIRDLLWLMVVVALGAGWLAERNLADLAERKMRERDSYVSRLDETVDHLLRLWEHDVPGTVGQEKGGGLYFVDTKQGRHYFPLRPGNHYFPPRPGNEAPSPKH
jgi:hypothetical protein